MMNFLKNIIKKAIVTLALLGSQFAFANQDFFVGAQYEGTPGLSLAFSGSFQNSIHISGSYMPKQESTLSIESLHFQPSYFSPNLFGSSFFLRPYIGYGIQNEADKNVSNSQVILLRGVLGTELYSYRNSIHIFLDGSPNIGPLPKFQFSATARAGIRTRF